VIFNRVERTITFTKKGYDLGVAFEGVAEERLYPSVGFRTPDEEVRGGLGGGGEGGGALCARMCRRVLGGGGSACCCVRLPVIGGEAGLSL
jgi:hypothetical protein